MRSQQKANWAAKRDAGLEMQKTLLGDPKTLEEYNAKIAALQQKLQTLDPKSDRFKNFNAELEKTKKELVDVNNAIQQLSTAANSINSLNQKLSVHTVRLNELSVGTTEWKKEADEIRKLNVVMSRFQAVQQAELAQLQGEFNAVKSLISALQGYGNTIGQIQAKLSAFQSILNNTTVGGTAFREAALQIKMMNEELNKANQLVQNYQSKAFEGVGKSNTDKVVREMEQHQQRIREIDAQMNLAHVKGGDMGSQKMVQLLEERIKLEETLNNMMQTGAQSAKKLYDEQIAAQQKLIDQAAKRAEEYNREVAAKRQQAAEEARIAQEKRAREQRENEARKRILNEHRLSYDTFIQKIQMLGKGA